MLKKFLSITLSVLIVISLTACSSEPSNSLTSELNTSQQNSTVNTQSVASKTTTECSHTYVNATCTSPMKCTKCGLVSGTPLSHSYSAATCISPKTCSLCGTTSGSALGHNYPSSNCTTARECTRCGNITSSLGHSYSSATCTSPKKCTRCGTTSGSALGHSDNGNGSCSRCGATMTIDMEKRVGKPKNDNIFGFSYYKNSANGIKLCWNAENLSGKTINYYTITLYFYNSVGDPAYSEITGKSSKTVKYVGPVQPNGTLLIYSVVDYVPVCSKVVVGDIKLEYSDGTSESGWYGYYTTYRNSALK